MKPQENTIYHNISEQEKANKILSVLYKISKAINSTKNLDDLFQTIEQALSSILDTSNFYIALYDKKKDIISFPFHKDEIDEDFPIVEASNSGSLTAKVINSQKPICLNEDQLKEMYSCSDSKPVGTMPKNWLGVPLTMKGDEIGAVCVQSYSDPNRYSEVDINILASVSEQIAIAIDSKRKEEALQESAEKYRNILESIEEGYYELDLEGNFIFINGSLCKLLGYSRDEIIGKNYREFMGSELVEESFRVFNEIFNTVEPAKGLDYEYISKDGVIKFVELSATVKKDVEGNGIGFRGVIRDITERKQSEKALQESERRYRTLFNSAGDAIFVHEMGQRFLDVNSVACERYGYGKDELLKMSPRDITTAERAKNVTKRVNSINEFGKFLSETIHITRNGQLIPSELSSSTIEFDGKKAILSIVRDITDRKKSEEEKQKMEAQLQRAKKMEAIGTLAGGVAHDLNNILTGLVSYPELILLELPDDSPLRKSIMTIQKSGEKASAIVQDLLTLARRGVATKEVVNLNTIIKDYLKSPEYNKLLEYHSDVVVELELSPDLLNVSGSPVHLSKSIMNLVSNGAEAMPHGGRIVVSSHNKYIDNPSGDYDEIKEGDYVVLTVSDTGMGIPESDLERIFEPFYTKKVMGRSGTGLGMAVVWGTVKDHTGYINVDSIEGKGTTINIYLPITRDELTKNQDQFSIDEIRGNGQTILVVDDIAEQREIATKILINLDYEVFALSSGEEATEYMKDQNADLILLDMIMDPGIDGLDTYQGILKYHPNQKAIIVSGFSETDRIKKAQKLGAGAYVKKPYLLKTLGLAVKAELER